MSRNHDVAAAAAEQPDGPTRHQIHAEERGALRQMSTSVQVAIGIAIILAMVSGTLGVALVSLTNTGKNTADVTALQDQTRQLQRQNQLLTEQLAVAEKQVRTQCRFYLDLARSQSALNARSQQLAFSLIGDAFNSYTGLGCQPSYGPLPKPDPRIAKYLDNGGR